MQENKRYEWDKIGGCEWIRDTEKGKLPLYYDLETVANLLNQQDKRIKDLEEQIKTKDTINNLYKTTVSLRDNDFKDLVYENNELKQENKQLKQLQKQLAISELEKIKELMIAFYGEYSSSVLGNCINKRIKNLKGEE